MATTTQNPIRVLAYREGDTWVAQCVEYDISSQGEDFETAMHRLRITLRAECNYTLTKHGTAFANIPAAPQGFARQFEKLTERMQRDNMELAIAA